MFIVKKEVKDQLIQLRVTEKQKLLINTMAQTRNMTVADLLNNLLELEFKHHVLREYKDKN